MEVKHAAGVLFMHLVTSLWISLMRSNSTCHQVGYLALVFTDRGEAGGESHVTVVLVEMVSEDMLRNDFL